MTNIMNVNPYLIRYMDDQYVNAFLKEGTLMLSSIYKFTDAELGLRQDLDGLTCKVPCLSYPKIL